MTRTLLMYVKENNHGSLGGVLEGLDVDEDYLLDTDNWVSHSLIQTLYHRMIDILDDDRAIYKMTLASERFQSLGLLDIMVRLLGWPRLVYSKAPKYNRFFKLNGEVHIHELGNSHVILEDRYHDGHLKTRHDCDYTRGILAGTPTMFGLPTATVTEIECQVAADIYGTRVWEDSPPQGCPGCLYRVDWVNPGAFSLFKRLFFRRRFYRRAIEDLQAANWKIQEKYEEARRIASDLEAANKLLVQSREEVQKRTAELKASKDQYRIMAENVTDTIWRIDLESMAFEYISPSVQRNRGFTPEEAMALGVEKSLAPRSLEEITRILSEELARDGKAGVDPDRSRTVEIQQCCKDGSWIWAEARVTFIRDENGRPIGILGVSRNINERKEVEKALLESEQRFRLLSDKAPFGIALIDSGGRYRYVNTKFTEVLGYTIDDMPDGKYWFKKAYPDPAYRREVIEAWKRGLENSEIGNTRQQTFVVTCKNGDEKDIHFRSVTLQDEGELVFYEDITEKRKLEAQLRQTQKMEAIGSLAGGIAHDFNNILSGVLGYTELSLREVEEGTLLQANMLKVLKAGERARELIRQILMFSRQGGQDLMPTRLNPIVKEVLKLLRASLPASIAIEADLQGDVTIRADPIQIHQVLLNLCTNASHAMADGGGTITVRSRGFEPDTAFLHHHTDLHPGRFIHLSVSDTGTGIDPAVRERIFDPYFTTKSPGKGTGMGLSVVHGIVKSHGGAITVGSEPGRGATFSVFLPVFAGETPDAIEKSDLLPRGSEHVFWVDDEPMQIDIGREILQRLGYTVTTNTSGPDALAIIEKEPGRFDLIITDMTMPRMTGDLLAQKILAIAPHQSIIMCTGYNEQISESKAKALGIREFIMKPIVMRDVAFAVRRVLDAPGKAEKRS